jgi:hypothetical protein
VLVVHMTVGVKLAFESLDSESIGDGVIRIIIMNHYCVRHFNKNEPCCSTGTSIPPSESLLCFSLVRCMDQAVGLADMSSAIASGQLTAQKIFLW